MEIKGIVTAGVIRDNETGRYKVDVGGREYEVVSKGRQAKEKRKIPGSVWKNVK